MGEARRRFDANGGKYSVRIAIMYSKTIDRYIATTGTKRRMRFLPEHVPSHVRAVIEKKGKVIVKGFMSGEGLRVHQILDE